MTYQERQRSKLILVHQAEGLIQRLNRKQVHAARGERAKYDRVTSLISKACTRLYRRVDAHKAGR
jgi:hypothetical protein